MYYKDKDMQPIKQYLVGEHKDGQFWCWAEFADKTKALLHWEDSLKRHKNSHIQLIERTVVHEVVTEAFPSHPTLS